MCIGILISIIMTNIWTMLIGRFLTSICVGILETICSKFTREIMPEDLASKFGFLSGFLLSLGVTFAFTLGELVVPYSDDPNLSES